MLADGSRGTLVIVRVFSAPALRTERARIAHARSCVDTNARLALELQPVWGGMSRTLVPRSAKRLFAQRTIVEVFRHGSQRSERVSCGELRR